jgi:membrane-associated phospholipid phosphatase
MTNGGLRHRLMSLAYHRERDAVLVLLVLTVLFVSLCSLVRSEGMLHWDSGVTRGIQRSRSSAFDAGATALTLLGNGPSLVVIVATAAIAQAQAGRKRAALLSALTLLGFPLNLWLKMWIGRSRPHNSIVDVILPAPGLSFPSGHAMISTMVFGTLAMLAWVLVKQPKQRVLGTAVLASLPLLIGLSRVYLGAHWLSDVVGGWAFGLGFVLVLARVYKSISAPELAQ